MRSKRTSMGWSLLLGAMLILSACRPLVLPDATSNPTPAAAEEAAPTAVAEEPDTVADMEGPAVTVVASALNLRAGPGTGYPVMGSAQQEETLPLTGQVDDCAWLTAQHPTLGRVWLSGNAQYTRINVDCASVPAVEAPALPAPQATTTVENAPATPAEPTPAPAAQSAPPAATDSDPLPADQGCYLFQNFVGPELNVTITAKDWAFSDNFRVPEGGEMPYCFAPGRYAVTVDAPPPWNSINIDLDVKAGERFLFPLRRRD